MPYIYDEIKQKSGHIFEAFQLDQLSEQIAIRKAEENKNMQNQPHIKEIIALYQKRKLQKISLESDSGLKLFSKIADFKSDNNPQESHSVSDQGPSL